MAQFPFPESGQGSESEKGSPRRRRGYTKSCQEVKTEMPTKMDPAKSDDRFSRGDKLRLSTILRVLGVASFLAFSSTSASAQSQQEALRDKNAVKGKVEHSADVVEYIYVAHSTRISTTVPPTAFCNKAPFKAATEGYFTWSSVETTPEDGRLSNPAAKTIGDIRGCFGSRETQPTSAYTEGTIAGIPFKGIGSCQHQANFPESGISHVRCYQALSGLPNEYVGGVILNKAIVSQNENGDVSIPPGYLQSGIATFRLWKKRR
jgi:hypothetical protein